MSNAGHAVYGGVAALHAAPDVLSSTEQLPCHACGTGIKPSWTAKLLANPELLCKKVREEAAELCQTLEESEGKERAASEAADLIYHAMVLLNAQVGRQGADYVFGIGFMLMPMCWRHPIIGIVNSLPLLCLLSSPC